jgi:hypothetical protein
MFEYTDASGQIYTEDQINKMAAEQKTSASAIIKSKGLKKKSSTTSQTPKQTKKTYPWSNQEEKKQESGFLSNFKKSIQKPKEVKPAAPMTPVESQAFLDELTASTYQQQFPQPFSMETEAFKKEQAKKAEEKKIVETADFKLFQKQVAELDLKKDREASAWVKDGIIASKIAEDELNEIDSYIDSEKKKFGQKIIIPGRVDEYGFQITEPTTEVYKPFATEVAKIKKDLAAKKLLNKFDDKTILEMAAADYRKNEIAKRKEDKFMDYLENTTDISDKSRKLADNYFEKVKAAEASSYAKDIMIRDEKENQISEISNKINELSKSIKPKGYKFQTQEEIDAENKKISQRNELIKIYELENINYKNINKKIDKEATNYDNVSFQQDLYKRDYSWIGQADKLKTRSTQWAYEMLGGFNYLMGNELKSSAYDFLKIEELTGIKNPFSADSEFLADRVDALSTDLQELYPKQRELTSPEGMFEKAGDLLINQAPDLIVMALTGGGGTAAKALQTAAKPSLLKKAGSYLALNKQTAAIAARGTGSKYLNMVSQEKNGYYDENGEFIKPDYSLTELLVAPAAYGYAEGVFERSTGKILEKGKGFFKAASNAEPNKWFDFNVQTTNKLIKKAGGNFIEAQVEEQLSEQLTNVVQNGVDKFILGKDVNLLANAGEVGQDTVLLTTLLAGAPILGGAAIRPFMSESNASKAFDNSRSMAAILHELEFNKDLSEIQKTTLQKKLGDLKDRTSDIFSSTVNNMADMSPKTFNIMNDTATEIATIMSKAKEVDASDSATKDIDLAELKNNFIKAKVKLDRLAVATESVKTFDKPISVVAKANLIDLAAQRVEVGFNDTLSEEERKAVYDSIEIETEKVYKNEGISLKEERVKEFEQNLKAAQKLAKDTDTKIIIANKSESIEKTINNLNKSGKLLGEITADQILEAKSSDGFIIDGKAGESFIIINREAALKAKAVTVASHEFLHKLLSKTLSNSNSQIALGQSLSDYLLSNSPELYLNEKVIGRLQNNYGNYDQGTQMEELLTVFSDAIASGNIKYKETFFTKIGDQIRRLLQDFGLVNIEFNSGRDVFNFIRDYNNTITKGKELSVAQRRLLREGAKGKLVSKEGEPVTAFMKASKSIEERMDALDEQLNDGEIDYDTYERKMIALEKEEAELARKEYEEKKAEAKQPTEKKVETKPTEKKPTKEKEAPELSEIAAKAKTKLDAIGNDPKGFNPNNPAIYSELDKMVKAKSRNWRTAKGTIIDFTNKDKGGLDGFSMEEMISYVRTSMIPYINKFDPSKNNSLYGYINAQYANRMKAALKSGEVADVVFTEDVTEMTKLSSADVEFTRPSLPERKRFQNILESGVFSPDVIDNIQAKILPVVRTLKSKINEKTSLNKTVTPIIAEIRDEMGKQADIDIKKAMGGKENQELQNWLIVNKKTILENMTTTWLMGKDNGKVVLGGMPFAIQKKVAGRWLNYPDWIGKKVDRESVETDLAGRTAGHELVRRLPEVNKNVSTIEFLSSIIDLETGNPIRGRKESLAKAIAEEVSFDIISDDIANDGIIAEALNRNQELKGAVIEKIMVEEFNRLTERGNIKFSLTGRNIDVNAAIKYLVSAKGDINIINLSLKEPSKDYNTNQFKKLHKYLISNSVTEDDINTVISKYTGILNKAGYGYHEKFIESIINSTSNKGIAAKNYGGNNNVLPDIAMGKKSKIDSIAAIRKNRNSIAFIEVKLSPFARITSSTLSSLIDKYSNEEWFDGVNDIYDKFKKSTLYTTLSEHFEKDTAGNVTITKARAIKIKPDGITKVKELLAGNISIGEKNIPLSSVKTINSNKPYPNDLLVLGTYVTDYFGSDFLSAYNINLGEDNNMNPNIINARIELKIDSGGFMRARVYFTISKPVANLIYKINKESNNLNTIKRKAEVIIDNKINTKYSKSLENNLNSYKGINNIDLVSKYISTNNIKRINAEDSFDVLNDLAKEIENYWGVVPDNIITFMNSAVDYAFDVIEDRENEGGPLMAAVNDALNLETIKNAESQLNKFIDNSKPQVPKFSKSLDYEFNDMLERNTGIESYEKISDIVAKRKGAKANRLSFFIPPSAEDFRGLTTYMFAGKGKQGELDQQFFDENLVIPYVKGINALDSVRQSIKREYKALLANFPDIKSKLEKLTPDKQFTYDQAIRVYLWNKNDIEVPGLSRRDKNRLVYLVKNDPNLVSFAESLSIAGRQDGGWMEPSDTWDAETIISELHNITEGKGRKKWLSEFIENANAIFSTENLNKVQSIYGTNVRVALEDSLYRMKNGKNRPEGTDALTNKWMNWINGSTAAIMFFNVRSALLQTISSINYLNWNDNNPLMAAKAFANQKQYWSDFATIINSDKMKERRAGLKADVTQAEIANAANSATNKAKGILSYLQKIGFTPTQAADSFSIAIGGAAFYRNRVNTYLEQADEDGNKINTQEEAEAKAWIDFSKITDQSMQSADPLYVSKQQTTSLGRLVLAFANTPMQYNRLIKKASLDLVNKRGDWKTNMSKILYYGALQNFIFSALQSALFIPFVDDDDEKLTANMSKEQKAEFEKLKKKQEDKTINILNGMVDTVLRGSGITGALIATIKNAVMEYNKQEQKEMFADHAYTFLAAAGISPPISSKARKLYGIHRVRKFEKDVIEERGWEIARDGRLNLSPNYSIVGNAVVATTNIPLDRIVEKVDNLSEALDSRNTALQRTALVLGWKEWELNVKNEENEIIKAAAKIKRKEEGIEKAVETRAKKKKEKEAMLKAMPSEERLAYRRKENLERRKKALEKRKRKMGGD